MQIANIINITKTWTKYIPCFNLGPFWGLLIWTIIFFKTWKTITRHLWSVVSGLKMLSITAPWLFSDDSFFDCHFFDGHFSDKSIGIQNFRLTFFPTYHISDSDIFPTWPWQGSWHDHRRHRLVRELPPPNPRFGWDNIPSFIANLTWPNLIKLGLCALTGGYCPLTPAGVVYIRPWGLFRGLPPPAPLLWGWCVGYNVNTFKAYFKLS